MLPEVDVLGFGENSVDRVVVVPRMPGAPQAPSKMRVTAPTRSCGGQVATTMAACAALGLRAAYAGVVGGDGGDDDGTFVRETLAGRGVDVTHLYTAASAVTRWASILVDAGSGERTVLWDRDAALSMTLDQIDAIDVGAARLVHVDDTDLEASIRLATRARAAGRLVTTDIDAAAGTPRVIELLKLATHPILSAHAVAVLSGDDHPERGLRALRRHCDGVLCVTLGTGGAMALDRDILTMSPGISVTAVDTTGAGDVFRAGFIRALLVGEQLSEILRFANVAAALSCTRMGAINSVPSLDEVRAFVSV